MAASAYLVYNEAKKYLLTGVIDLDTSTLSTHLYKGSSNASTFTLSTLASVTVKASGGYSGVHNLGTVAVTAGASAKQIKFDAADLVFTASGANIGSVQYHVIGISGSKALCWSKLSSAAFTVTDGNTLTIAFHASGIFTLT